MPWLLGDRSKKICLKVVDVQADINCRLQDTTQLLRLLDFMAVLGAQFQAPPVPKVCALIVGMSHD